MSDLGLEPMSNFRARSQAWLWDAMIPADALTIIAGSGGSSKSTLMAHLCADITRGRLPGDHEGVPRGVVYLTQENDTETSLCPKMEAAGADMDRLFVMGASPINVMDHVQRRSLISFCVTHDVVLIVLDPMLPFLGGVGSYAGSVSELTTLMGACSDAGITVVGVNHLTKSGKKAEVDSMMGSVGIASTARQVLMVGRTDNDLLVGVVKSNVGPTGNGWLFSVEYQTIGEDEDRNNRLIDAPVVTIVRPAKRSEVDAMLEDRDDLAVDMRTITLLMYVHENDRVNSQDAAAHLQEEFGIKGRTARGTIGQAVAAGLVKRVTCGSGADLEFHLMPTEAGGKLLGDIPTEMERPPRDLGGFKRYDWVEAR